MNLMLNMEVIICNILGYSIKNNKKLLLHSVGFYSNELHHHNLKVTVRFGLFNIDTMMIIFWKLKEVCL